MTQEIIEAEVVEARAVAVRDALPATVFGTTDPAAIMQRVVDIATPLAKFIREQGMTTNMGGRTHVNIEGWSFMGAMMGIAPVVTRVSELKDGEGHLFGFEAQVELRTRDGSVVGGGIGECSRGEAMWSWEPVGRNGNKLPARDDFALKSMAQTRATGKAYRLAFGFIMKAAGYDATPAEEMPGHEDVPSRQVDDERTVRTVHPMTPRRPVAGSVDAPDGTLAPMRNGGDLLNRAMNQLGMLRAEVQLILNVESIAEVTDYEAAWAELLKQKEGAAGG